MRSAGAASREQTARPAAVGTRPAPVRGNHNEHSSPGERANALLKNWRILRKLRYCPWRAGQLAKAIHTLAIHAA